MPRPVAMNKVIDPAVSAHTPCMGDSRVIREPIVRTIRHPPSNVPSAIAAFLIHGARLLLLDRKLKRGGK